MKAYIILEGKNYLKSKFFQILRKNKTRYHIYRKGKPQDYSCEFWEFDGEIGICCDCDFSYEPMDIACRNFQNGVFVVSGADRELSAKLKDDFGAFHITLVDVPTVNNKTDILIFYDADFEQKVLKVLDILGKE